MPPRLTRNRRLSPNDPWWGGTIAEVVTAIDAGKIPDVAVLVVSARAWRALPAEQRAAIVRWGRGRRLEVRLDPALMPGVARTMARNGRRGR